MDIDNGQRPGKYLTLITYPVCSLYSFYVQASYYDGNQDDRYTFSSYSGGQFVNDRLSVVEMRANRYYSPVNNFITIRTSTEHPRVS